VNVPGVANQAGRHFLYDASGSIVTGGTPQLILPETTLGRSYLSIQNTSAGLLMLEWGSARAKCTISGGVVNSVTVTNGGFNFTKPPLVEFQGGGNNGNSSFLGLPLPNASGPGHPAKAHAVLSGGAVSSIVIDDPGSGYVCAPFVFIANSNLDPYGCAAPSASVGYQLFSGTNIWFNGFTCPTDSVAVYGATTAQTFVCKFMT
jgi:hypothetical protein